MPNSSTHIMVRDIQKVIQSLQLLILPYFASNKVLFQSKGHMKIELYLCTIFRVLEKPGQFRETGSKYLHYGQRYTESISKSLTLHLVSNKSLASLKTIRGVSYNCFRLLWALGQFGEIGPT